jgi:hypothetical protein
MLLMEGKVVAVAAEDRTTANRIQGRVRTQMRHQSLGLHSRFEPDEQQLYLHKTTLTDQEKKVSTRVNRRRKASVSAVPPFAEEVVQALVTQGFPKEEATDAVQAALPKTGKRGGYPW